jgi:3-methyladenine DNA glycosylase Mpg
MAEARGFKQPEGAMHRNKRRGPAELGDVSYLRKISSGPGRMCEALGITRQRDNGKSLADKQSDLRIVDDGYRAGCVLVTRRIGIRKSADEPLRFVIDGNPFVSGAKLPQDMRRKVC